MDIKQNPENLLECTLTKKKKTTSQHIFTRANSDITDTSIQYKQLEKEMMK